MTPASGRELAPAAARPRPDEALSTPASSLRRGQAKAALVLLFFSLAGLFVFFGANVFPLPAADSQAFVPPAISLHIGHGLRNPLSELDTSGKHKFLQYPPLFPLLIAALMPGGTPRAAFLVIAGFNIISLFLLILLLLRLPGGKDGHRLSSPVEMSLAVFGAATALVGNMLGRPEALATPMAMLACASMLRFRSSPGQWWIIGSLIAFTAATYPMGALLVSMIYCAVLSFHHRTLVGIAIAGKTAILALAAFAAILGASPYGLWPILKGTWLHARLVLLKFSAHTLSSQWLTSTTATFYALPYLAALGLLVVFLLTGRIVVRSKLLFAVAGFGIAVIAWLTVLRAPELSYNFFLFAPLIFAWNLYAVHQLGNLPARLGLSLFHALASVAFLRFVALLPFFLAAGVPLSRARAAFAELAGHTNGRIAITSSFWTLSEDYDRMKVVVTDPANGLGGPSAAIIQQNYTGLAVPPRIPGFALVEDRFVRQPCKLFGVTLAHTMPGFGYATYLPIDKVSPESRPVAPPSRR